MKDLQMLKARKKELGFTNQAIADLSGVPLGTVQKIFSGATRAPRSTSLAAIEKVLFPEEERNFYDFDQRSGDGMLKEPAFAYGKAQQDPEEWEWPEKKTWELPPGGGHTYAEYAALPDDRRVELIDGRFYEMAAPNSRHQIIIGQLFMHLQACAQAHPECMVLLSPMDVMLDLDDSTVVQPDIMVVCDRSKMRKGRIFGAPDLVIEVVSPGSRTMDYGKKAGKYIDAGVREYWVVDYKRRTVAVYLIDGEVGLTLYGMDAEIPVYISGGTCSVRMKDILDYVDALGDI